MATESATMNLNSAVSANLSGTVQDVTISNKTTDGATSDETLFTHEDWGKYYGLYMQIPEVKIALDARAVWTLGKGFKTNDINTEVILDHISGWGNDTFNGILKNMIVTRRICGDAFAEIIRDPDTNIIINLKPLDPSTITIVADKKGILKEYRQTTKTGEIVKFKPQEIFHLVNKRVADNIHGVSDLEALQQIILASNENFMDMKQVFHRHVKPIMAFKLDTDDSTKIATFMSKMDQVINKGENIYIPKDTVDFELVTVPSSSTLSPFQWIEHLKKYFYQVVGIPQVILGSASEFSESASKITYLAFQQSVEDEQLDIEEQVWNQLQFEIELEFPATIQNELISDSSKDGQNQQMGFQPNDMTVNAQNQGGGQ